MIIKNQYQASEKEKRIFFSTEDANLLNPFEVPSSFDSIKDQIEIHIYDPSGGLLLSEYDYKRYSISKDSVASPSNLTILTIDPVEDIKFYGFSASDVNIVYNFLRKSKDTTGNSTFYIKNISPDRTELQISSVQISEVDQVSIIEDTKNQLTSDVFTDLTSLNFFDNTFIPVINATSYIAGSELVIAVKLYTRLPDSIQVKDQFEICQTVSDSKEFEVTNEVVIEEDPIPPLRGPNFNIELPDDFSNPTEYLNNQEILSSPTNLTYKSYYKTSLRSAEIGVDYTDFSNFIHFSSAEERLNNFKYKIQLLEGYQTSRSLAEDITPLFAATASIRLYNELIENIITSFDGYEKYLYFESGSKSWPKLTTQEPYINTSFTSSEAIAFYNNELTSASLFDQNNPHRLLNSIPRHIVENPDNAPYNLFIDMIGQHFDNLWLYAKSISDRYNGDNRLERGISKDLVGEALKSFGIKIYGSNSTLDQLFSMFSGEVYQTGSEDINFLVTSSLSPISKDDYQAEVLKRIFHNTPLLLKSKGTERGIKALISSFGIPSDFLDIKYYGGTNSNNLPFFGPYLPYTSSLDRIRLDNTGSIIQGSTLSYYRSIVKPDEKYTQDLHTVEVGFSPSDNINNYIISESLLGSNYDINQYLGDPGYFYSQSYDNLDKFALTSLTGSFVEKYNIYDLARLLKFYDNRIFKMVKDFIPARSNVSTGIIIKPHLLNRSKVKRTKVQGEELNYSGSIAVGRIRGGSGGSLAASSTFYNTGFTYFTPLPSGSFGIETVHTNNPRITGELSGSQIVLTTGELNPDNPFKKNSPTGLSFRIRPVTAVPPDTTFSITVTHISP